MLSRITRTLRGKTNLFSFHFPFLKSGKAESGKLSNQNKKRLWPQINWQAQVKAGNCYNPMSRRGFNWALKPQRFSLLLLLFLFFVVVLVLVLVLVDSNWFESGEEWRRSPAAREEERKRSNDGELQNKSKCSPIFKLRCDMTILTKSPLRIV